jgi:ATP-binding cassette subfamily B protein
MPFRWYLFVERMRGIRSKVLARFRQLSYIPPTMRLIWSAAPKWTAAWGVLLVVQGLIPVAVVYLTKLLVDNLVKAVSGGGSAAEIRQVFIIAVATAAVMLLAQSLDSITEWVRTAQSELVQDHIKRLVHEQSITLDLSFYESADFYDSLDQARGEASGRSLALLESFGSLLQNCVTLLAMAAILLSYSLWLPLILLVTTAPAFYVVMRFDRRYHDWWKRTTVGRRWLQYYDSMLTQNYFAAELRLYGLGKHFQSEYQDIRLKMRTERLKHLRQLSMAKMAAGAVALLAAGAILFLMGRRALNGAATMGDLALFYQAFSRGQGVVSALLGSAGKIYTNSLFLENLFQFLRLKPNIIDPPHPISTPFVLKKGIEFHNVTFYYPGSNRPALKDFSLKLPAGKIIAIVGTNGAGKTTLLKLLCRFYDPQSGSITLDGQDIREFSTADLWRRLTVLFQQPSRYFATAGQSIAMSDLGIEPSHAQIVEAARLAGADEFIRNLPRGYDTELGKWVSGGVELSGGEWQRVAMARAYLRESSINVLDEPTSFLDSWNEADWFDRFREWSAGRTSIVITHRFTIAMRADIIFVMDGGDIVEYGSHQRLIEKGGFYARSWETQMSAAQDQDSVLPVGVS